MVLFGDSKPYVTGQQGRSAAHYPPSFKSCALSLCNFLVIKNCDWKSYKCNFSVNVAVNIDLFSILCRKNLVGLFYSLSFGLDQLPEEKMLLLL